MEGFFDSIEYYIHLAILILMYGILAQSFNLNFGIGRSFNLAHGACFALGAYGSALLSTSFADGWTAFITETIGISWGVNTVFYLGCIVMSIIVSSLLALLIGGISLRLSSDYFAIGTLAFSSVISALLTNWKSLTRGVLGIPGIPRPQFFGISAQENSNFLLLLFICFLIVQIVFFVLFKNVFSRRLRAQAESETAATALGINCKRTRLWSFVLASAGAGVAGAVFAFYLQYIDPSSFSFVEMVFVLTITVVGRPGSFWGCLASVAFLLLLPEWVARIQWINDRPSILGPMRQLLYSLILYIVVLMNKRKLFPSPREV